MYTPFQIPKSLGGSNENDEKIKIIHCHVWGDIEVDGLARAIIDTWAFQRLHYIRKMGFVYKVFPTATTSRFEHAIGSYHVTKLFLSRLYTHQPELFHEQIPWYLVPIAVLCQHLGAGPFSHVFDMYLSTLFNDRETYESSRSWIFSHDRTCDIMESVFGHVTFPYQFNGNDILFLKSLLSPERYTHKALDSPDMVWLRHLIRHPSGIIDMATVDSLLRDCKAVGMACPFDFLEVNRLLSNCRVLDGHLSFCDRIVDNVQNLVVVNHRLQREVFFHQKVREYEVWAVMMLKQQGSTFQNKMINLCTTRDVDAFLDLIDDTFLSQWIQHPLWRSLETRVFPRSVVHDSPALMVVDDTTFKKNDETLKQIRFHTRKKRQQVGVPL